MVKESNSGKKSLKAIDEERRRKAAARFVQLVSNKVSRKNAFTQVKREHGFSRRSIYRHIAKYQADQN